MTQAKASQVFSPSHAYETACDGIIQDYKNNKILMETLIKKFITYASDYQAYGLQQRSEYVDKFLAELDKVVLDGPSQHQIRLALIKTSKTSQPSYKEEVDKVFSAKTKYSRTELRKLIQTSWNEFQPFPKKLPLDKNSPLLSFKVPAAIPEEAKASPPKTSGVNAPDSSIPAATTEEAAVTTQEAKTNTPDTSGFNAPDSSIPAATTEEAAVTPEEAKTSPPDTSGFNAPDSSIPAEPKQIEEQTQPKPNKWGQFFATGVKSDLRKAAVTTTGITMAGIVAVGIWWQKVNNSGDMHRDFEKPLSTAENFVIDHADAIAITGAVLVAVWLLARVVDSKLSVDRANNVRTNTPKEPDHAATETSDTNTNQPLDGEMSAEPPTEAASNRPEEAAAAHSHGGK